MAVQALELGFDCRTCDDILKKERGCEAGGIIPFKIDNEYSFRCPLKSITSISWEYIRAYGFYRKNILPHGNGWLVESEKFLSAMSVLDKEIAKVEEQKAKK